MNGNDALKVVGVMAAAFIGALVGVLVLRWMYADHFIAAHCLIPAP